MTTSSSSSLISSRTGEKKMSNHVKVLSITNSLTWNIRPIVVFHILQIFQVFSDKNILHFYYHLTDQTFVTSLIMSILFTDQLGCVVFMYHVFAHRAPCLGIFFKFRFSVLVIHDQFALSSMCSTLLMVSFQFKCLSPQLYPSFLSTLCLHTACVLPAKLGLSGTSLSAVPVQCLVLCQVQWA